MDDNPLNQYIIPLVASTKADAWGRQGADSLAGRLFSQNAYGVMHPDDHFSEMWLGTHPSAPTCVAYNQSMSLLEYVRNEVIEVESAKVEHYQRLHKRGLPFLLRVVSVGNPQSIHAHPDDSIARKLHEAHPDRYPDSIGKPEMSVALSVVDALFGFRPAVEIVVELARVPEFAEAVGRVETDAFVKVVKKGKSNMSSIRSLFTAFVSKSEDHLKRCLTDAVRRLRRMPKGSLSASDHLLLAFHAKNPTDLMCFAPYFLNHVSIPPGSAIFILPGEPHAYLSGDLIEVSSCSDSTVHAGLTTASRDLSTFTDMLTYDDSPVEVRFDIMLRL